MEDALTKIRAIRAASDLSLKPSPYLKATYLDDSGIEQPVQIRNYQAQGIMNLLQVEEMLLGDDTGLGKTLEVLSTIGYVWLKEPEYVPIVLTRKSALYQWGSEIERFMQQMEAITIDGEPYERNLIYQDFFLNHDFSKKRLLVLTYDQLLRDTKESVIRDKEKKPDKQLVKQLREARANVRNANAALDVEKALFKKRFDPYSVYGKAYLRERLLENEPAGIPQEITEDDLVFIQKYLVMRNHVRTLQAEADRINDLVAPPKVALGILSYVRQLKVKHPNAKLMLVMDEMHVLKNPRSQIHKIASDLAIECSRKIGMTATPVKNKLMEFFSLFCIIRPGLMPKVTHFYNNFCYTKLQDIGGGKKVTIVLGYKNLDSFVKLIEPYYLSRRKHDVAKELPQLVSREIVCMLSEEQQELYDMAESGLLELDEQAEGDQGILKAMTLVQQAVDHPSLIANEDGVPFEGPSCKEEAILDLLSEELDGVKVIIFSRFERMISLLEKSLTKHKIKTVRITGKENNPKIREKNKQIFQDMNSGVNVILITSAGAESINLQAAEHIIFVDSPWSWGDYVQITGRSIRIGSQYLMVVATHLRACKRDRSATIDDHVLKTLKGKKALADKVAGEALKDGLKFISNNEAADIFNLIRESCRDKKKTLLEEVNQKLAAAAKSKGKIRSSSSKKAKVVESPEDVVATPVGGTLISTLDLSDI
jgi:SNF2 family DNA or RNA helicase